MLEFTSLSRLATVLLIQCVGQVHKYTETCISYNTGKSALSDIYARCLRASTYISGKACVPVL